MDTIMKNDFKDVIIGTLLGDGCIIKPKNGKNAHFVYLSSSKEHVEYVFNNFKNYCNTSEISSNDYFDKRTQKVYRRFYFRTKVNIAFTELYNSWYPNGVKVIPNTVEITPTVLRYWYIGDGHLKKDGRIILSTNGFSIDEVIMLMDKIKKYSPIINLTTRKQPIVIIPRIKAEQFLKDIGNCPIEDYSHKWAIKPYIIKGREHGIRSATTDERTQIIESYLNGETYYSIAKRMGFSSSMVRNLLIRKGFYHSKNSPLR
jgi:hypothetical protein